MKRTTEDQTPSGRLLRLVAASMMAGIGLVTGLTAGAAPAGAQADDPGVCPEDPSEILASDSVVHVVKVAGLIDPVVADHVLAELERAEEAEALALVIWMNSRGSVVDDSTYLELATALAESPLDIGIWVGQSGSTARGGAAELLAVADVVGVSPGATIGDTGEARLPDRFGSAFGDATERLRTTVITADEAVQLGISVGPLSDVALIGAFLTNMDGYEVFQCIDEAAAVAGEESSDGDSEGINTTGLRTYPVTQTQLSGLPVTGQLFHTVASPEVAYLFFVMGLGLLVFELFTAGVGVAGMVGAAFLVLGCYGLGSLPTRPIGLALLLVAFLAMAVDVQTNVPRLYTVVGLAAFTVGTFVLYDGVSMSWITIGAGLIGAVLYAYAGMPSMVRTRFSTPTIGRKWMIGEMGEAITDVTPEGTVRIRDVAWRAITNRATPVKSGDRVRVVGLDRLLLEIEPEEGGAKDYRERR